MNTPIRNIRKRLGLTQQALADGMGCTQGNIGHYERGQTVPPEAAAKLIDFAASRGLYIGFDHVYGRQQIHPLAPVQDAGAGGLVGATATA